MNRLFIHCEELIQVNATLEYFFDPLVFCTIISLELNVNDVQN